jgi:gliding motility-associated-like protein
LAEAGIDQCQGAFYSITIQLQLPVMLKPTRRSALAAFVLLLLLQHTKLTAQFADNKGTEFWLCFPKHTQSGANQARMMVYITSIKGNTRGMIKINNYTDSFFIAGAGQFIEKEIPYNIANINEENLVTRKGIRITSNSLISVYAHIFAGVRSAAYMALPVDLLGNSYYSCNYTQRSINASKSQLQVVAVQENTRILITPRIGGIVQAPITVDLPDSGSVYQYTSSNDISGSEVLSIPGPDNICKDIAVFSGSSGTSILSAICNGPDSYDPLVQQLYPVIHWAKTYALTPYADNPAGYHVRVIAAENNTTVNFNGVPQVVLQQGEVYPPVNIPQMPEQNDLMITADKPVSVAQYLLDNACNGTSNGDPDMIMVTPVAHYPEARSLYTSSSQNITSQFIKITTLTSVRDSVRLNGNIISNGWTAMTSEPGLSYNNIRLPAVNLPYEINTGSMPDTIFEAQVYGLGNAESYLYPGGVMVPVPHLSINRVKQMKTDGCDNFFHGPFCINDPFYVYLHCPFEPSAITWLPHGFGPPVTEYTPVLEGTEMVGEKKFYIYKLNQQLFGTVPGIYTIEVIFQGNYPGTCYNAFKVFTNVKIWEKSVVDMDISHNGCLKDSVQFSGVNPMQCNPPGGCNSDFGCKWAKIASWVWDFGDGTMGSGQNPYHFYSAPGTYTVNLYATAKTGCPLDVVTRQVTIDTLAKANFGTSAPYCEKQRILFTDSSRFFNITDTLKEWHWNMGDGTVFVRTDSSRFEHSYGDTGLYHVSLVVKTKYGCFSDTLKKTVYVSAVPVVKYGFTNACQNDPFVQFTDSSTIKDNTESGFSYLWTFGDPAATAANPNTSALKNPTHQYTLAGSFPVSLTVTSSKGCAYKKDSVITISSAAAAVDFTVSSANQFCSNTPVLLLNQSSIAAGSIRKLKIYWDAVNNINDVTVDSFPFASAIYQHAYPVLTNTPDRKDYSIKLEVTAGQTCSTALSKIITLHAMPVVNFGPVAGVCSDTPYVLVTSGAEVTNLTGNGNYFGNGISPAGLFDVKAAGAGMYRLGYAYTSMAGCTDTAYASFEVFAIPTVSTGPDITLPEDLSHTFSLLTTGAINGYLWSPPLYLDNALIKNATVVNPKNDVLYTIRVSSPGGCAATDKVLVKVVRGIAIPNTFTPNNDGINDTWLIDNLDKYTGCRVQVFTRTGQKVFESKGYGTPWNGKYKDKALTTDTYYYIIELNNGKPGITGYVQIVR